MNKWWIMAFPALLVLVGCSDADTLGDEPPVSFNITGRLTWENGIDDLVRTKCAYCHTVPRPDIAPQDITPDLDLNQFETRLVGDEVIRGADAIGSWINEGLLEGPVDIFSDLDNPRQMPLDYGTQLTADEITVLRDWSDLGLPRDETEPTGGDADAGADPYFDTCATCHAFGAGVQLGNGLWVGPPFRRNAVTVAKIRSMWLHKIEPRVLSDQEALDIKAFILEVLLPESEP